jgi:hypothetical protein
MGLANSYALRLAGINKDTPDPTGGLILRDNSGNPTGILIDNAITLIKNVIPKPDDTGISKAATSAMDYIKQFGITGIHDITEYNELPVYQKLDEQGLLTCRINSIYPLVNYKDLLDRDIHFIHGTEKLRCHSLKAFADGSLGSGTAWFSQPYTDQENFSGLPTEPVQNGVLEKLASKADNHKLQLCIHAIGDKANNFVLNLYKNIREINPIWIRRSRIEHAQHLHEKDIELFKELNIIASVQPAHLIEDGVWAERKIGSVRVSQMYAFKSLQDKGIRLCFGSDWTVASINPLLGIYAAVTRRTVDGKNPEGWIPKEKISVEDAIRCYTINNAFASYEENEKGSIEPGKLADFVVLDEDILTIPPEKIKDVNVALTIFDGEIIYR